MLESHVNNKLKRRLLNIFFHFPKRSFHVNELKRLAGSQQRTLSRALRELRAAELVDVASRKKHRYFRINPFLPFYFELRQRVKEERVKFDDEVTEKLKSLPNLKLVILSGVFTLEPDLPIDVLLVGGEIRPSRLEKVLADLEKLVGQEINYTVMDEEEFDQRRFLHDRLVRDVLDHPHLVIFGK